MKEITSIPNAPRTFHALRNLGYNLYSSIADLVDNSITEKVAAKTVHIGLVQRNSGDIVCQIQDDGVGMSPMELEEAMRLGTDTSYENNDLGKFGMGMKTASLSHCNILTVISKKKGNHTCGYRWDISKINRSGKWTLLQLEPNEINQIVNQESIDIKSNGTIVLWEDLFNINRDYKSYKIPKFAQNYFFRVIEDLKLHLGMTYHRFLDKDFKDVATIKITVNGDELEPWDPFCRDEPKTERLDLKSDLEELYISGYDKPVYIKGYILPSKEGFSSVQAWKNAKGLLSWNDSQGYYIYRANRLIRYGGWHGTKAKDEHDKLARISIDIDSSLDELFSITVNKNKVQFPEILYHHLKSTYNPKIIGKAKAKYNSSNVKKTFKNKFRNNDRKIHGVTRNLLEKNNIQTSHNDLGPSKSIEVSNPSGTWLSNKISDFLKYGGNQDYEIVSDQLDADELWKIVCDKDQKFKVILNSNHPFYSRIYNTSKYKSASNAVDALIFSLAFAELYNRNDQNAQLFNTFKSVCARALEKLTEEDTF